VHYFLGLEVWQRTDEIFMSQGKYIVEILKRFGMTDCKSMPISMVMNLKMLRRLLPIQERLIHIFTNS
jgi:hypothetical protein